MNGMCFLGSSSSPRQPRPVSHSLSVHRLIAFLLSAFFHLLGNNRKRLTRAPALAQAHEQHTAAAQLALRLYRRKGRPARWFRVGQRELAQQDSTWSIGVPWRAAPGLAVDRGVKDLAAAGLLRTFGKGSSAAACKHAV